MYIFIIVNGSRINQLNPRFPYSQNQKSASQIVGYTKNKHPRAPVLIFKRHKGNSMICQENIRGLNFLMGGFLTGKLAAPTFPHGAHEGSWFGVYIYMYIYICVYASPIRPLKIRTSKITSYCKVNQAGATQH